MRVWTSDLPTNPLLSTKASSEIAPGAPRSRAPSCPRALRVWPRRLQDTRAATDAGLAVEAPIGHVLLLHAYPGHDSLVTAFVAERSLAGRRAGDRLVYSDPASAGSRAWMRSSARGALSTPRPVNPRRLA